MKRLLCIGMLLLSANSNAATYCTCARYESETRFDGPVGLTGNSGKSTFFGVNNTYSENIGTYSFKTDIELVIEFPGEQRHFCTKVSPLNWDCKRGRNLRYSLVCEF
jgi:hypothetical protein